MYFVIRLLCATNRPSPQVGIEKTLARVGLSGSLLSPLYGLHHHLQGGALVNGKITKEVAVVEEKRSVLARQAELSPRVLPRDTLSPLWGKLADNEITDGELHVVHGRGLVHEDRYASSTPIVPTERVSIEFRDV